MSTGQARGSVVGWAKVFASGGPQSSPFRLDHLALMTCQGIVRFGL